MRMRILYDSNSLLPIYLVRIAQLLVSSLLAVRRLSDFL
jgi:hypothetical protein